MRPVQYSLYSVFAVQISGRIEYTHKLAFVLGVVTHVQKRGSNGGGMGSPFRKYIFSRATNILNCTGDRLSDPRSQVQNCTAEGSDY